MADHNGDFLERLVRGHYSTVDATPVDAAAQSDAEFALKAIASEGPQEADSGGTRVLVPGGHVQLGAVTEELVEALAELGFSALDPTHITKVDAFRRLGFLLWKIRKFVQNLDLLERDLCRKIVKITLAKKDIMLTEPGATEKQIADEYERREELAPENLHGLLDGLTDRHVLERKHYKHSGPFYRVVF